VSLPVQAGIRPPGPAPVTVSKPGRSDSVWWLAAVAAAFSLAQLVFVAPHLGLSWDETVYISQVSMHAPAAFFDPPRARGVTLLVAPVTLLTSSIHVLRVYLSVLSGLGLFLALLSWRRLRPAWQLAVAGVFFASLWTTQYYGPQAMPDLWVGLSSLAAVGLFLRAAQARGRPGWWFLAGAAGCLGAAALVRPGDALYLAGALILAVALVPRWRQWPLAIAVVAGFAAGAADWVVEAYVRFGGPLRRLRLAGAEQGGFGWHFAIWGELRALDGPTLCRPCTVAYRYPAISIWWLLLPVLLVLGALAARRAGLLGSSVLASACALALAFQYLFLIYYAAPRFLIPAYALAAIGVSDVVAGLITGVRPGLRPAAITAVVVILGLQLAVQHAVLVHQVKEKRGYFGAYARIASDLHKIGVRSPCLIKGDQYIPIAYYAGCESAPSVATVRLHDPAEPVVILVRNGHPPPGYARTWHAYRLRGISSHLLRVTAWVPVLK